MKNKLCAGQHFLQVCKQIDEVIKDLALPKTFTELYVRLLNIAKFEMAEKYCNCETCKQSVSEILKGIDCQEFLEKQKFKKAEKRTTEYLCKKIYSLELPKKDG